MQIRRQRDVLVMRIFRIESHQKLQELADLFAGFYAVEDFYILRSAMVEALQNTVQHSNGRFAVEILPDKFTVVNLIKPTDHPTNGIGLQIFSGIYTCRRGNLFYTDILPGLVKVNELNINQLVNA